MAGNQTLNSIELVEVSSNPSEKGVGIAAPVGTFGLATNGAGVFQKRGTLDTEWKGFSRPYSGFEDFLITLGSGTNAYSVVVVSANSAAGSIDGANTSNNYCGAVVVTTGTATLSRGRCTVDFFNSINKISLSPNRLEFEIRLKMPVLSTSGTSYAVQAGLADGNGTGTPTNGVYFHYTHGTNGGAWRGVCVSGSTETSSNTAITVVADRWYVLKAVAVTGSVDFYIDDVFMGTVSSNVPTAAMRFMGQIEKLATLQGTSRDLILDYVYWRKDR